MEKSKSHLIALICTALILAAPSYVSGQPSGPPFAARIGWLHDACLAIENPGLNPGTPVTIIRFGIDDEPIPQERARGKRVAAQIIGKTESAELCPALNEDRRIVNQEGTGLSFYTVSIKGPQDTGFAGYGIGIVGLEAKDTDRIDLDGDGVADSFTLCRTKSGEEEVSFSIWTGAPYEGRALWTGTDFLSYAYHSDCPD